MKKWIIMVCWASIVFASDQELKPLVPKLTHPLTLKELATCINDKNQLDLTKLGTDIFCTEYCCVYKFITLNSMHKGLQLLCKFDSDETAQKFEQNLNQLSTKKFIVHVNPIR
jgi:hypothetical protein